MTTSSVKPDTTLTPLPPYSANPSWGERCYTYRLDDPQWSLTIDVYPDDNAASPLRSWCLACADSRACMRVYTIIEPSNSSLVQVQEKVVAIGNAYLPAVRNDPKVCLKLVGRYTFDAAMAILNKAAQDSPKLSAGAKYLNKLHGSD